MDFKYKWKNGRAPSRDEAATERYLLDESQFENDQDRHLAEDMARKQLNVPATTIDEDTSILPQATPPEQKKL